MPEYSIYNRSSESMDSIGDDSANLVVTSPPYNVGTEYDEYDDSLSVEEYEGLLSSVLDECQRILQDDGRIAVNVAPVVGRPMIDLPAIVRGLMDESGFQARGHYIWDKGASESSSAWGSWRSASNPYEIFTHEHILVGSVEEFGRQDRGESTMSKNEFMRNVKSVWQIQPANREDHPAPFPVELPRRAVDLHSYVGDTVVDPFMGVGSTGVAAVEAGRSFIGYDISDRYCSVADERITNASSVQEIA